MFLKLFRKILENEDYKKLREMLKLVLVHSLPDDVYTGKERRTKQKDDLQGEPERRNQIWLYK